MGRRSQRSRANQTRERARKEASESERPDDVIDKPTETDAADEGQDGNLSDTLSQTDITETDKDVDMPHDLSQDDIAEENQYGGGSTESEVSGAQDSADTLIESPESEAAAEESGVPPLEMQVTDENDIVAESLDTESGDSATGESADDVAAGYASIEADQNPQTCCSNCRTIFEVSPELLSSSDTRVRCGECLSIFDALANLRQPNGEEASADPESDFSGGFPEGTDDQSVADDRHDATDDQDADEDSLVDPANNPYSLDVTYADFGLFSADAALPDIDYLDETREPTAFNFDDPGGDDDLDETYSETVLVQGPEVDARSAIQESDITDEYATEASGSSSDAEDHDAENEASNHDATLTGAEKADEMEEMLGSLQQSEPDVVADVKSVSPWRLRIALSLLMLSLAGGLYGYRERDSLLHSQYVRPPLEKLCSVVGCTLSEQVDLASLQVLKRSVFSHPKLDNMLVINVDFVNTAAFSQRYPILEIRLTDRTGGLVTMNSFDPADYLDNWQKGDLMAADGRLGISLNVEDPGNQAMSFELDFR